MAKTKESKLEEEVSRFMEQRGVWQLARFQAQSNQNGLPDRIYLYKGVLLGFELKTDTGEPTDLQLRKLEEINNNGGVGLIIRNVNTIASVLNLIDSVRRVYPGGYTLIQIGLKEFYEED